MLGAVTAWPNRALMLGKLGWRDWDVCHEIGSLTSGLRFLPLASRLLS